MKTVGDRIIIEPMVVTDIIPGMEMIEAHGIPQRGTVLACGIDTNTVKVGDEVVFSKGAGHKSIEKGKDVIVMRETDLFWIV